jgi:HrpA-like RNA helicase
VTHVFIDEVHERGIETDFLLMVLRDLLSRRAQPLKLILMSATLDARLFHDYFGGAPSVKFPGRTFPVTDLYLEHAMEATRHVVYENADWAKGRSKSSANKMSDEADPTDQPELDRMQWQQQCVRASERESEPK